MTEDKEKKKIECKICGNSYSGDVGLRTHISLSHDIGIAGYMEKYANSSIPECSAEGCNKPAKHYKGDKFLSTCGNEECIKSRQTSDNPFGGNPGWKKGLTKEDHPGIAAQAEKISGANNPYHSMSEEKRANIHNRTGSSKRLTIEEVNKKLEKQNMQLAVEKRPKDMDGTASFHCKECNNEFERRLGAQLYDKFECPHCSGTGYSKAEKEILEFVKDNVECDVLENTRDIISPRELDIYIPEYNFAIEYNGLYWHTNQYVTKEYHKEKTEACMQKDIDLMHIFSDQWAENKDIVKSMILHRLGKSPHVVYARECEVKKLNKNKEFEDFFEDNHIDGHTKSSYAYALMYDGDIISCLSIRTPMHYDNAREIARFATKLRHHVPGAFSRLFKYAKEDIKENGYDKVITYADLRYGEGSVYEINGFDFLKETKLNYWYTDGKTRVSRHKVQATDELSERELAEKLKLQRVYGCGNNTYRMKFNKE